MKVHKATWFIESDGAVVPLCTPNMLTLQNATKKTCWDWSAVTCRRCLAKRKPVTNPRGICKRSPSGRKGGK